MHTTCVRNARARIARRTPALAAGVFLLFAAADSIAQEPQLPPITVGAGLQTSFAHTAPEDEDSTDSFALNSVRLYVNGPIAGNIKFEFNTEYDGSSNNV